jgi:hypothetical protein
VTDAKQPVDIFIVMNGSGEYVLANDEDEAIQLAEADLGDDDDVRQVRVTVLMSPADGTQLPVHKQIEID